MAKPHCWKDKTEHITDLHGFGSDEWAESFNEPSATCMLESGHEGPHEFVPDSQIGVTFIR